MASSYFSSCPASSSLASSTTPTTPQRATLLPQLLHEALSPHLPALLWCPGACLLHRPANPAAARPMLDYLVDRQGWAWLYAVNIYIAKDGEWSFSYLNHLWSLAILASVQRTPDGPAFPVPRRRGWPASRR